MADFDDEGYYTSDDEVVDNTPLHRMGLRQRKVNDDNRMDGFDKGIFWSLRKATTDTYCKLDDLDWSREPEPRVVGDPNTRFWDVFSTGFFSDGVIQVFDKALRKAGRDDLNLPDELLVDYGDLAFYEGYFAGKVMPKHYQMANSPLECFLMNHAAFCTPLNDGSGHIVCDFSEYNDIPVIAGAANYGGRAILAPSSADGEYPRFVSIDYIPFDPTPGSNFQRKLNVFLSTFALELVAVRHATVAHLSVFQRLLTKFMRKDAGFKDAVMRNPKLEKIFQLLFTRTNVVSVNEVLLIVGSTSLVGRATSFEKGALTPLLKKKYDEYSVDPLGIYRKLSDGLDGWKALCQDAWDACSQLIERLLADAVDADVFTELERHELTLLVWVGTFYRTFIGDLQVFNVMNGCLPFNCTGEPHRQTKSMATLTATIGVTTLTRTYTIADELDERNYGYFGLDAAHGRDEWETFSKELGSLTGNNMMMKSFIEQYLKKPFPNIHIPSTLEQMTEDYLHLKSSFFNNKPLEVAITEKEWNDVCDRADIKPSDLTKFSKLHMKRLMALYASYVLNGDIDISHKGRWVVLTDDSLPTEYYETENDAFDVGADRHHYPPQIFTARIGDSLLQSCELPQPNLSDLLLLVSGKSVGRHFFS